MGLVLAPPSPSEGVGTISVLILLLDPCRSATVAKQRARPEQTAVQRAAGEKDMGASAQCPTRCGAGSGWWSKGATGFTKGPAALALVDQLRAGNSPLTVADFANYEARWRTPPASPVPTGCAGLGIRTGRACPPSA